MEDNINDIYVYGKKPEIASTPLTFAMQQADEIRQQQRLERKRNN